MTYDDAMTTNVTELAPRGRARDLRENYRLQMDTERAWKQLGVLLGGYLEAAIVAEVNRRCGVMRDRARRRSLQPPTMLDAITSVTNDIKAGYL